MVKRSTANGASPTTYFLNPCIYGGCGCFSGIHQEWFFTVNYLSDKKEEYMEQREKFGTRLGFILVSAGCAVGLGNVWRFPYVAGENGGAAFILIYLIFLALIGVPCMVAEFTVGRGSRKSVATSFKVLAPEGTKWSLFGYLGMMGNYVLMMFYTTVAGWLLYYFYQMITGSLMGMTPEQVGADFGGMLGQPYTLVFWMILAVVISFGICAMGLQNGVEKVTKFMMIVLLLLMVVMAVKVVLLPGAMEGVKYYLIPDFGRMMDKGFGNVLFAALGQAFFTLSIGIGSMAIMGSYLDRSRSITGEAVNVTVTDTFVALVAGLIIIPSCFAFGIEPGAGPGLIFITLPNIFNQMAGGQLWGIAFFAFMSFAALSTVVAVFENIISFAIDLWGWSRGKAVAVNIILVIVGSLPCALGFNLWSGFQPLGEGTAVIDLEDFIVSYNLLPLGSMVYLAFCTRRYGWGWGNFLAEVNTGKGMKFIFGKAYIGLVIPLVVTVIYLKGYWDFFTDHKLNPALGLGVAAIILALFAYIIFYRKPGTVANEIVAAKE